MTNIIEFDTAIEARRERVAQLDRGIELLEIFQPAFSQAIEAGIPKSEIVACLRFLARELEAIQPVEGEPTA